MDRQVATNSSLLGIPSLGLKTLQVYANQTMSFSWGLLSEYLMHKIGFQLWIEVFGMAGALSVIFRTQL